MHSLQVHSTCSLTYACESIPAPISYIRSRLCRRIASVITWKKWILTAVCPYNFLPAIPVPDKAATTAANALLHDILLVFGFLSILQSDRDGEGLNDLLHRLTKLLSIKQVFTSSFRLRLNGATERAHRFLNAAIGIYCKHFQEQ